MFMFFKLVSNWRKWQGNMELKVLLASKTLRRYIRIYAWIFVVQVMLYVFLPSRSCRVLISQKGVPQITRYSTDWKHCVCMLSGAVIICTVFLQQSQTRALNVFCPHYAGKIWKRNNQRSFVFGFEKNSGREITSVSWCHRSRKDPLSKGFPSTLKRKFLRFEERLRKVPSLWWSSVDGRPTRESKMRFQMSLAYCGWGLGCKLLELQWMMYISCYFA